MKMCADAEGASEGAADAAGAGGGGRRGGGARRGRPRCALSGWKEWVAGAGGRGGGEMDLVFELHLRLGAPLAQVADVLGLELSAVRGLWAQGCAARKVPEPRCEGDLKALREQVGAALWQTVEATFSGLWLGACGAGAEEPGAAGAAPSPMLGIRLKALKQIVELYHLDGGGQGEMCRAEPYSTPEEIAGLVRERVLELHGRGRGEGTIRQ